MEKNKERFLLHKLDFAKIELFLSEKDESGLEVAILEYLNKELKNNSENQNINFTLLENSAVFIFYLLTKEKNLLEEDVSVILIKQIILLILPFYREIQCTKDLITNLLALDKGYISTIIDFLTVLPNSDIFKYKFLREFWIKSSQEYIQSFLKHQDNEKIEIIELVVVNPVSCLLKETTELTDFIRSLMFRYLEDEKVQCILIAIIPMCVSFIKPFINQLLSLVKVSDTSESLILLIMLYSLFPKESSHILMSCPELKYPLSARLLFLDKEYENIEDVRSRLEIGFISKISIFVNSENMLLHECQKSKIKGDDSCIQ